MAVTASPWQCLLTIQWRSYEEGGRRTGPPSGPAHFATAVFVLGGDADIMPGWPAMGEHFSVALEVFDAMGNQGCARARFLAPDLAGAYLIEGAELLLMEGPRAVAEAVVVALGDDGWSPS